MKFVFFGFLILHFVLLTANPKCDQADLILEDASIYNGLSDKSFIGSIGIKDSKISFVDKGITTSYDKCDDVRVLNLKEQFVYPGFVDGHGHLKGIGYRELTLNLQGISSLDLTLKAVENYLSLKKPNDWIIGRGWIDKTWPEKRFPTRWDIDSFAPNNPVVLERADGHAVVVNSVVLKLANIDSSTPDPHGGFIEKDSNGEPTGLLVDMAMNLIADLIPKLTRNDDKKAFIEGIKRNVALGWTQIHVPGGTFQDISILNEIKSENNF